MLKVKRGGQCKTWAEQSKSGFNGIKGDTEQKKLIRNKVNVESFNSEITP